MNDKLLQIAEAVLYIETLETQNRDSADFHNVSVWSIKEALELAYAAGKEAGRDEAVEGVNAAINNATKGWDMSSN